MIAYRVPDSYDVITVPDGWDCFKIGGWLYRRSQGNDPLFSFYREKWIGAGKVDSGTKESK